MIEAVVAANLNAYDFIYTKLILTKSKQRTIIFKSEQQWQTNKSGKKEIESGSSLAWTKHDKYKQQEHKLSVFFIKLENIKKALISGNPVTYHFIATINKGKVLHLSSPSLNSSTILMQFKKKIVGRNKKTWVKFGIEILVK